MTRVTAARLRCVVAALVVTVTLGTIFHRTWPTMRTAVPGRVRTAMSLPIAADLGFETWLVARNARTWVRAPNHMFDAEHCAPAEHSLTFGIPMLTMGLLGIPAVVVTGDPVITYNVSVAMTFLLAASAMYLLVLRWTGTWSAAVVAALLYAFHAIRVTNVHHPASWDTSWTVFAIFFADRWLCEGRWRDAVGFGGSCALQIGASFYPLLAAALFTPAVAVWLLVSRGVRRVWWPQVLLVVALVAIAATFVLSPYLATRAASGMERPESYASFSFAAWSRYLPGDPLSPGWLIFGLAAVAIVAGRSGLRPGVGDPRWALLAGASIVAFLATGADTSRLVASWLGVDVAGWNPYFVLGRVLPGLKSVRGIDRLSAAVHLASVVLAGIGAAALVRRAGRTAPLVAAMLVMLAWADVVRPAALGLHPLYSIGRFPVKVSTEHVQFFEELARRGNSGPLFEVPPADGTRLLQRVRRIMASFYHERRTSECFGSYYPAVYGELAAVGTRLPAPDAVQALGRRGFTTIVVHHHRSPGTVAPFLAAAAHGTSPIRLVFGSADRSAFEIFPAEDAGRGPDP